MMGTEINSEGIAVGKQEINPEALGKMDAINNNPGYTTLQETMEAYVGAKLTQSTGVEAKPATFNDLSFYNQVNQGQSGEINKFYYTNNWQTPNPPHNSRFIPAGTDTIYYSPQVAPTKPFHSIQVNPQQINIINKKNN